MKIYAPQAVFSSCVRQGGKLPSLWSSFNHFKNSHYPSRHTMALPELPGTIDYLTDAAHILQTSAPQVSAHLMSQRETLLSQHGIIVSDVQRQHVCGACGHIMIPGQAAALKLETRNAIRKSKAKKPASAKQQIKIVQPARCKVVQCGSCRRETKIKLDAPRPAKRQKAKPPALPNQAPVAIEPPKATANASSKKRAKNRKAGLQALLSGQQKQSANPLSLSHFMKK